MRTTCFRAFGAFVLSVLALSTLAVAKDSPERFQMNHDIRVSPGESTGDVSCLNCSVYIRGQVTGDVFAMHGNVVVETGGSVAGDVSTLVGDVRMESGSSIGGSVAAIAGAIRRQPDARIGGDSSAMEGLPWLILLLALPLVMLAACIAFVIWLVQRVRRPVHAVA